MTIELNSGNFIQHFGGPALTPYARGILSHYPIQIPLFSTVPSTLTGVANERRTVVTDPFQYDALYFGAHSLFDDGAAADSGENVYLQVTDLRTGLYFASPGSFSSAPITAYAGVRNQPMSILLFPEAFFVPAGTRLKLDFSTPFGDTVTGGNFTVVGVQLIDPCSKETKAECVKLPDGQEIRVGSRMPWLHAVGVGREQFVGNNITFALDGGEVWSTYTPPVDCDIEITDVVFTFFGDVSLDPDDVVVRITDSGDRRMFTLNLAPTRAVFGDLTKSYPALPFCKPYLLKKNRRLRIEAIFRSPAGQAARVIVVFRGVRLCEF